MNILYLHSHDTGRFFLNTYSGRQTDWFVSEWCSRYALNFRNAFCAAPTCSPSRAALLTGKYPHSNGMLGLAHRGFCLDDYENHLTRILGQQGYTTALCGVQHEAAGAFDSEQGAAVIGYAENLTEAPPADPSDGDRTACWDLANAENAARWLGQTGHKPFFLSCGFYSTHREYPSLKTVDPERVQPAPPVFNDPGNREDQARFIESAKVLDSCCQTVLEALMNGPYAADTIVLLTTDHGPALPFCKCRLNAAGMGVGLSLFVPGKTEGAGFSDALVSQVDVLPTLCGLTGARHPAGIQGKNFCALLDDPSGEHRSRIFSEVNFHTSYEPMRAVRTRRYSYVRHFAQNERMVRLSNIDNSHAKDLLIQHGLKNHQKPKTELYDLIFDPQEQNNLAQNPEYQNVASQMEKSLVRWQTETRDPLQNGELKIKPDYIVNTPQCSEPDSDNPTDYL